MHLLPQGLRPSRQLQGSSPEAHGGGVNNGWLEVESPPITESRSIVLCDKKDTLEQMSARYRGMLVFVKETGRFYVYKGEEVVRVTKPQHERWSWWRFWSRRRATDAPVRGARP